jgi:hypothetical protein
MIEKIPAHIYKTEILIDLPKLMEAWDPFSADLSAIWQNVYLPISRPEIRNEIDEGRLIPPDVPRVYNYNQEVDIAPRIEHVRRIAWFAVNLEVKYPIPLEFHRLGRRTMITIHDGNHRLYAAAYLQRKYIVGEMSGPRNVIGRYRYRGTKPG